RSAPPAPEPDEKPVAHVTPKPAPPPPPSAPKVPPDVPPPPPAPPQWDLPPKFPPSGLSSLNTSPPEQKGPAVTGRPLPARIPGPFPDFESKHEGPVTALALLPGGRQLLTGGMDQTIRVWDAVTGQELRTFTGQPGPVHALAVNGLGTLAASGGADGAVHV